MKEDFIVKEMLSFPMDMEPELIEELFDKIGADYPNCDVEMCGCDNHRFYYIIKKRPKKENKVFKATIGVVSFVLIVLGMITLLTGMSYGIEFIGISQIVKILGMIIIITGAIGLFCALNVGKWE